MKTLFTMFAVLTLSTVAWGQDLPLVDDIPREELARYGASLDSGPKTFSYRFNFPADARSDRIWGIDVSHHSGKIDWGKISDHSIVFAYAKATQGVSYYDRTFKTHWQSILDEKEKGARIFRGAYHFMSSQGDAIAQADNFLRTVGQIRPSDLPPCLDLEWDFEVRSGRIINGKNGKPFDRWSLRSSDEIVAMVTAWSNQVEEKTGRKPIIYTNAHWWAERVGTRQSLAKYSLWIADYGSKSLGRETPNVPTGHKWLFWQITDKGTLKNGGIGKTVDTNVYVGTREQFAAAFPP